MAASLESRPPEAGGARRDPGDTLIDLLSFAEQITAFTPDRRAEKLAFPVLARMAAATEEKSAASNGEERGEDRGEVRSQKRRRAKSA